MLFHVPYVVSMLRFEIYIETNFLGLFQGTPIELSTEVEHVSFFWVAPMKRLLPPEQEVGMMVEHCRRHGYVVVVTFVDET